MVACAFVRVCEFVYMFVCKYECVCLRACICSRICLEERQVQEHPLFNAPYCVRDKYVHCIRTYICTCMHAYINEYVHTYIRKYTQAEQRTMDSAASSFRSEIRITQKQDYNELQNIITDLEKQIAADRQM